MPTPVTAASAWELVQAVTPANTGADTPQRVHHSARRDLWLQVEPSGHWRLSVPASRGARDMLDLYLPLQLDPAPVIGQIGQSLDGRIATDGGHSHYVTGQEDRLRLHRLRALSDAVIVGAGTASADNPRLTVRAVDGANPTRVILDPHGRLSPHLRIFTDGAAATLVVRRDAVAAPPPPGAEEIRLPITTEQSDQPAGFAPALVVDTLRARGLQRLLVEGGGVTVSRFLQAGVLTRLHVAIAPILIGSGRSGLSLPPIATLDQALRPPCRRFQLGDDVLFDLDLR